MHKSHGIRIWIISHWQGKIKYWTSNLLLVRMIYPRHMDKFSSPIWLVHKQWKRVGHISPYYHRNHETTPWMSHTPVIQSHDQLFFPTMILLWRQSTRFLQNPFLNGNLQFSLFYSQSREKTLLRTTTLSNRQWTLWNSHWTSFLGVLFWVTI